MYSILFCILLLWITFTWSQKETFENIKEDIGNYLSKYFYHYAISVCQQKDFHYPSHPNLLLKYLPERIPFRSDLYQAFQQKRITLEKLGTVADISLWECRENWIMDTWTLLKPVIQPLLKKAIEQSDLVSESKTIIHFRCADTPFIKHISYHLQRYAFFKDCLEKIHKDSKITLMNCSTHRSGKEDQEACSQYVQKLTQYLNSLGYEVETQCKTNGEDFADLFQAKAVISTGGSFSFMSGFFGEGMFLSSEHSPENSCDSTECSLFMKGYNIPHEQVESYHDIEKVYTLLV